MGRLYDQSVLNRIGDAIQTRYRPAPQHTCSTVTAIIWEECPMASISVITPLEKCGEYWPFRFEVTFGRSRMTFPQPGQPAILCAKYDEAVQFILNQQEHAAP